MITVPLLLMIVALVLFAITAFPRGWGWWGLFCVTLAQLWPLVAV